MFFKLKQTLLRQTTAPEDIKLTGRVKKQKNSEMSDIANIIYKLLIALEGSPNRKKEKWKS